MSSFNVVSICGVSITNDIYMCMMLFIESCTLCSLACDDIVGYPFFDRLS